MLVDAEHSETIRDALYILNYYYLFISYTQDDEFPSYFITLLFFPLFVLFIFSRLIVLYLCISYIFFRIKTADILLIPYRRKAEK